MLVCNALERSEVHAVDTESDTSRFGSPRDNCCLGACFETLRLAWLPGRDRGCVTAIKSMIDLSLSISHRNIRKVDCRSNAHEQ
jgi:hypothetical protein